tara:strand:- start:887 stop:1240 length:354 start_codon:yes stop_codon:yes gene_type:complete
MLQMQITNKLGSLAKTKLFICLFIGMNFIFGNTDPENLSNSKVSETEVKDFIEKTKKDKKEDSIKKSSNNNFNEIMSTTGACTASCCAENGKVKKVDNSKKKSNGQNIKKRFGWFSR